MNQQVVAIIPARYRATRLPGKPLLDIAGRPMIVHVAERARSANLINRVIVATDDERIARAVEDAGFEARMTSPDHATGTDRVAEVARALDAGVIVNVQGDEPLLDPRTIDAAIEPLLVEEDLQMSTTSEPVRSPEEVLDPNVVKVVVDGAGYALYFSRSPIPYPRRAIERWGTLELALEKEPDLLSIYARHTGLYVYRRAFLLDFASMPGSSLERAESLEQLRALGAGVRIRVIQSGGGACGVDTEEDLIRVRRLLESG